MGDAQEEDAREAGRLSVLVALHNEPVRRGICSMLEAVPSVDTVLSTAETRTAVTLLEEERPDILLVRGKGEMATSLIDMAKPLGSRVLLLLEKSDSEAVNEATMVMTDGFILQNELTLEVLGDTFVRLLNDEFPIPASLGRSLMARARESATGEASRVALLTPREQEVLRLLAMGLSNKQIARRLTISEHGVKRHVTNILAKLNCPNRTMAVAVALREGLV